MNHKINTFAYENEVSDKECKEKFEYRSET